jgi:hypothetical protein
MARMGEWGDHVQEGHAVVYNTDCNVTLPWMNHEMCDNSSRDRTLNLHSYQSSANYCC